MRNQFIIASAVCFCMLSCGQTDLEKSLFSEKTHVRFLIAHEGPANSAAFSTSNLTSYPSTDLGEKQRRFDIWRTQSDAIVILELDHTETNDPSSGKFRVFFEGDGRGYFEKSRYWAGWNGGVMIPGEGLYTLQDSTLKFLYTKNHFEDFIEDDYSSGYKIEYEFIVNNGRLVLKSTDLGISPTEIKSWGEKYNANLVKPTSVDSLVHTIDLHMTTISQGALCPDCSCLSCDSYWGEDPRYQYHGLRVQKAWDLVKAMNKEDDARITYDLRSLLSMVRNEGHRCEEVRLTATRLKVTLAWALANETANERTAIRLWTNTVIPGHCELQGEEVEAVEDWFSLKADQVKPGALNVVNGIAQCGWSHYRKFYNDYTPVKREFELCEGYLLQAIELGKSWELDVSNWEEALDKARQGYEEKCSRSWWGC